MGYARSKTWHSWFPGRLLKVQEFGPELDITQVSEHCAFSPSCSRNSFGHGTHRPNLLALMAQGSLGLPSKYCKINDSFLIYSCKYLLFLGPPLTALDLFFSSRDVRTSEAALIPGVLSLGISRQRPGIVSYLQTRRQGQLSLLPRLPSVLLYTCSTFNVLNSLHSQLHHGCPHRPFLQAGHDGIWWRDPTNTYHHLSESLSAGPNAGPAHHLFFATDVSFYKSVCLSILKKDIYVIYIRHDQNIW